jgi:hypothetical protein
MKGIQMLLRKNVMLYFCETHLVLQNGFLHDLVVLFQLFPVAAPHCGKCVKMVFQCFASAAAVLLRRSVLCCAPSFALQSKTGQTSFKSLHTSDITKRKRGGRMCKKRDGYHESMTRHGIAFSQKNVSKVLQKCFRNALKMLHKFLSISY